MHWDHTRRVEGYLGDAPSFEQEETFFVGVASTEDLVEIF
ncbi:hypothetical protein FM113_07270 [Leucobacter sp. 7(1)]|nr:hypothetical protein FM113_07270 [Leucobacter sp. 7(1)]